MRFTSPARLLALSVTTALLAACGGAGSSGTSPIPGTAGNGALTQSVARSVSAAALAATPTPTPNPCYCPPHRTCSDIACLAQPHSAADAVLPAARAAVPLAATPTPTPNPCYCPPHQRICSDVACLVQPRAPADATIESRAATAPKRTETQ